jgi:hypothetical protein
MPKRDDTSTGKLITYVQHRDLNAKLALENGWYVSSVAGDEHWRIVIPCTHSNGRVYWQARAVDPAVEKRYQSPPYSAEGAFVLVWPEARPSGVVLVEGPFDALAAADCGYAGVAMMGNRPGANLLQNVVNQFPGQPVFVVPDLDAIRAGAVTVGRLALIGVKAKLLIPVGAKDLSRMPVLGRRQLLGS